MKELLFTCCILFPLIGCFDFDRKVQDLEAKVQQQALLIEEYQEKLQEVNKIKSKMLSLQKLFNGVMVRLDGLDKSLYEGKYVTILADRNATRDEVIEGYVQLINQLERDATHK